MKSVFALIRKGKYILILGTALMITVNVNAQTDNDDTPPSTAEGETDVPFDGGVSLLVAAAIVYGAKQWRSNRQQVSNNQLESL